MWIFLQQFIGHHDAREAVNVVTQATHRVSKYPPERSRTPTVRDAEVDRVGERPAPVDPVVRGHGIVASFFGRKRFHPDGVGVSVNASVFDH